tara:strand:- start:6340 stop:7248 length:909 start_codon:yes stop_codon:yes gene_type:complete
MDRHINYSIVGLFVLTGLIGIFIFLGWYAGTFDDRDYDRYSIHFPGSVNGLTNGGLVNYRGVEVGKIIDIRFEKDRPDIIMVDVSIDSQTPVSELTDAQLKPKGITGVAFIELVTENMSGPPIVRKEGQKYPVIEASSSTLDRLFDDIPKITHKILKVTERLDMILSEENARALENAVASVSTTNEKFSAVADDISQAITDLDVKNLSAKLDNIASNVEGASADTRVALGKMSDLSTRMDRLLARNEGNVDRFLEKDLAEFSSLVVEMRAAANAVSDLARELEDNPSSIIYKQQQKGVEIPR